MGSSHICTLWEFLIPPSVAFSSSVEVYSQLSDLWFANNCSPLGETLGVDLQMQFKSGKLAVANMGPP